MDIDPITKKLLELILSEREVVSAEPGIDDTPRTVTFHLSDGSLERLELRDCEREQFMEWWKAAARTKRRFQKLKLD